MSHDSTPAPEGAKPIHVSRWGKVSCRYFLPPSGRLTLPFSPLKDVVGLLGFSASSSANAERVFVEGPYCDILVWINTENGRERLIPHDYAANFIEAFVEASRCNPKALKRFLQGSCVAVQEITRSSSLEEFEQKRDSLMRNVAEDRAVQVEGDVA